MLLILKWGGELTPAGRVQAEELGRIFRCMYPGGQGRFCNTTIHSFVSKCAPIVGLPSTLHTGARTALLIFLFRPEAPTTTTSAPLGRSMDVPPLHAFCRLLNTPIRLFVDYFFTIKLKIRGRTASAFFGCHRFSSTRTESFFLPFHYFVFSLLILVWIWLIIHPEVFFFMSFPLIRTVMFP